MKKLILPFLFLFILFAKGQTNIYHPFPDSNAVWNENYQNGGCQSPSFYTEDYSYIFSGDTLINNYQYHKLFIPYVIQPDTTCAPYNSAIYVGAIRQDIVNKKVFLIYSYLSTEEVLYDFNLRIGDTLKGVAQDVWQNPLLVTSIDSILIGNNYRLRWTIDNANTIIEGIGSTLGLLHPCRIPLGPSTSLSCFRQNGFTLFPDTISQCDTITKVYNLFEQNYFTIFPNPVHTTAKLKISNEFINSRLLIFNSLGKLVKQQIIKDKNSNISREGIANGVYFGKLINERGLLLDLKIIVQ